MSGPLFFAVLMVLVLVFGVAMFWQESKRMRQNAAIYGVEDSIEWIWEGLGDDKRGLRRSDVRRILEWEMHYLQQPDVWKDDGAAVVGGLEAATYVQEQSLALTRPGKPVLAAGDGMTGPLAMGAQKITGLGDATVSTDAMNMGVSDARYLNLTGGTMSGPLAMGSQQITGMAEPAAASDAVTKNYVDGLPGKATVSATAPSTPVIGQLWAQP